MQKVIFLTGFPAAGKSSFAQRYIEKHPEVSLISADETRKRLYGSQDAYGEPSVIYRDLLRQFRSELENGNSIIYDAANLRKDYRLDFLRDLQEDLKDVEKSIIIIPTSKEICIDRHLKRGRDIPLSKILPYFQIVEPPTYEEGWDNIWTCCAAAYIAAPFFSRADRDNAILAAKILREKGIETYLPLEHKIENAWDLPNFEWGKKVFDADIQAINQADTVIVLSYGRIASAGTSWEAGYAYGIGKRVILVEMPGVRLMSLMVANGRYATIKGLMELQDYDFIRMPMKTDDEMEQK